MKDSLFAISCECFTAGQSHAALRYEENGCFETPWTDGWMMGGQILLKTASSLQALAKAAGIRNWVIKTVG